MEKISNHQVFEMVVEAIPKVTGMIYAIVSFFILVYLFYKVNSTRKQDIFSLLYQRSWDFLSLHRCFQTNFNCLFSAKQDMDSEPDCNRRFLVVHHSDVCVWQDLLWLSLSHRSNTGINLLYADKETENYKQNSTYYCSFALFCYIPLSWFCFFNRNSYISWIS